MANQTGISIVIKAFLTTGKTLDEQFAALSLVKKAHETSDYSELLQAATVEEVKTEQKTRRVEDKPEPQPAATEPGDGNPKPGDQNEVEAGDHAEPQTGAERMPEIKPQTEALKKALGRKAHDADGPPRPSTPPKHVAMG